MADIREILRELLEQLTVTFNDFGTELGTVEARILLLGLTGSGISEILHKLRLKGKVTTIPKIGFTVEEVTPIKNVTFSAWTIGEEKVLKLKRQYYQVADALVFVVDASDVTKFERAREELYAVLHDEAVYPKLPFMILANKQDLPNALKAVEIVERMNLEEYSPNPWLVHEMHAKTGNGLVECIQQLSEMVKTFKQTKPDKGKK